jgi:hypothetical protein
MSQNQISNLLHQNPYDNYTVFADSSYQNALSNGMYRNEYVGMNDTFSTG